MTKHLRLASREWGRIREAIFARDDHICQIQGPRCTGVATEVDHIKPLKMGGSNQHHNLRALCHSCHIDRATRNTSRVWVKRPPVNPEIS